MDWCTLVLLVMYKNVYHFHVVMNYINNNSETTLTTTNTQLVVIIHSFYTHYLLGKLLYMIDDIVLSGQFILFKQSATFLLWQLCSTLNTCDKNGPVEQTTSRSKVFHGLLSFLDNYCHFVTIKHKIDTIPIDKHTLTITPYDKSLPIYIYIYTPLANTTELFQTSCCMMGLRIPINWTLLTTMVKLPLWLTWLWFPYNWTAAST